MDFVEFVDITRPILGGKSSIHTYVKTLFDAILTENGKDILDSYKDGTFKSYANGSVSINKISRAMVQYIDPVAFSSFIFDTEESVQQALCDSFSKHIPNINISNVGYEIGDLFESIIRNAAGEKRKKPAPRKDTGTNYINLPNEQPSEKNPYSTEDKMLLQEFTDDYDEIILIMLGENYGTLLIDQAMMNKIQDLYKSKWISKADNFLDPTLKSYVFGLLGELTKLSNIFSKDSTESLSIKISRTKIRNLYVKLHPDTYSVSFPYEAFIDDWNDGEF